MATVGLTNGFCLVCFSTDNLRELTCCPRIVCASCASLQAHCQFCGKTAQPRHARILHGNLDDLKDGDIDDRVHGGNTGLQNTRIDVNGSQPREANSNEPTSTTDRNALMEVFGATPAAVVVDGDTAAPERGSGNAAESVEQENVVQRNNNVPIRARVAEVDAQGRTVVLHYVTDKDTFVGIALRYGTTVQAIQRENRFFSDNVHERESLRITVANPKNLPEMAAPTEEELEEVRQRKAIRKFMVQKRCNVEEATFYVTSAEYNLEAALANHDSDCRWEGQHPISEFYNSERYRCYSGKSAPTPKSYEEAKAESILRKAQEAETRRERIEKWEAEQSREERVQSYKEGRSLKSMFSGLFRPKAHAYNTSWSRAREDDL